MVLSVPIDASRPAEDVAVDAFEAAVRFAISKQGAGWINGNALGVRTSLVPADSVVRALLDEGGKVIGSLAFVKDDTL